MHGTVNFTAKEEVVKFLTANNIRILNLCHIPEEGRLKSLSFSVANKDKIQEVLDFGERVDGSNLFSSIDPKKSDIYIMPRTDGAFINPFAILPTLNVLCDYLDETGKPLDVAPRSVLARAEERLRSSTGITLKVLAELEFYVIAKQQAEMLFPGTPERNYHESAPFAKFEDLRNEILATLDIIGLPTKYGHGEVGQMLGRGSTLMEQHEIEFAPQNPTRMADTIAIAKWTVRNVCARHGVSATFAPKTDLNHAGTGMHIHMCGLKNGENVIVNADGTMSNQALRMMGGILKFAPSLAAFGNPTPVSYLRFIARKESPMHVCWSARNRLALIRIPLWWSYRTRTEKPESCRETFEYRAPDAFADAYLLFAGLILAAGYGLKNSGEALKIAEDLHVEAKGHERKRLRVLPVSCAESAENLERDRQLYEEGGVFPPKLIDETVEKLKAYKDGNLWEKLSGKPREIEKVLTQYMHCG